MKLKSLCLVLVIAGAVGCGKDDGDLVSATIEGYDLRECACCGGLLVKPGDMPGDVYQWYQKNGDLGVTYDDKFPMNVKIKYHHLAQTCVASDGEIEITELKKQ